MNKNYIYKILFTTLIITGVFIGIQISQKPANTQSEQSTRTIDISISISGIYEDKVLEIPENYSILDTLSELDTRDANLKLTTKDYGELGVLVTGMAGKANGEDNKYWQYKVNGVIPQIGADKYMLKNSDFVEWYFDVSEF